MSWSTTNRPDSGLDTKMALSRASSKPCFKENATAGWPVKQVKGERQMVRATRVTLFAASIGLAPTFASAQGYVKIRSNPDTGVVRVITEFNFKLCENSGFSAFSTDCNFWITTRP